MMNNLLEEFEESSLQEFVDSLELLYPGEYKNDEYVITLNSSNDFSILYNLLSNNKNLSINDNPIADNDTASFIFSDGEFEVKITADFNKVFYRMVITRK